VFLLPGQIIRDLSIDIYERFIRKQRDNAMALKRMRNQVNAEARFEKLLEIRRYVELGLRFERDYRNDHDKNDRDKTYHDTYECDIDDDGINIHDEKFSLASLMEMCFRVYDYDVYAEQDSDMEMKWNSSYPPQNRCDTMNIIYKSSLERLDYRGVVSQANHLHYVRNKDIETYMSGLLWNIEYYRTGLCHY
jgi:hypothetical protein